MVLVKGKYFRVCTISRVAYVREGSLGITKLKIKEGLAIEKKCDNGDYYYVVSFVRPEPKDEDKVILENVSFRPIEMLETNLSEKEFWYMMQEYKNCVEFAKQTLEDFQ